ncbi:hypothetical protein HDR61_05330 [bacterium]|nr:hypothetical protein [bacterium]
MKLLFRRENLDYSIKNYAYIEHDALPEDSEHTRHLVADICEEGNRDRVTSILRLIHSDVVEMLYPYTKREVVEEVVDDSLWEPESYMVELNVPVGFSQTSVHLLSPLIHEYMVCRCLYDWLTIAHDEPAAAKWLEKGEAARSEIMRIKNMRRGVLTRPLQPF